MVLPVPDIIDEGIGLDGDLSEELRHWPALTEGSPISVGEILFPRLDREVVLAAG